MIFPQTPAVSITREAYDLLHMPGAFLLLRRYMIWQDGFRKRKSHLAICSICLHVHQAQVMLWSDYHQLTRADTVLTGRNAPILRQAPWQYGKYSLRVFSCLDTFLLRQNCSAPVSDGFSRDFWFLRRRRARARQGEKGKKRRKAAVTGVSALVN